MPVNIESYKRIREELGDKITLVAVSKTKPVSDILELYNLGHRDFGENYVQELVEKAEQLPNDICWHFIGHLQTNKIKLIVPFVHLIHGVDSLKLFKEIDKQSFKLNRVVNCLFQVHIASEETKFGFSADELEQTVNTIEEYKRLNKYSNVNISGLMGMASFNDNMEKIRSEFKHLRTLFEKLRIRNAEFRTLSMGMSSDYKIAIKEGSTMVRIGSLLFGERENKD